jgi:hypothetical protein
MRISKRGARSYNNALQMPYLRSEIERPYCPNGPRLVLQPHSNHLPVQMMTKSKTQEMDEYSRILMATNGIWANHPVQPSWTVSANSAELWFLCYQTDKG